MKIQIGVVIDANGRAHAAAPGDGESYETPLEIAYRLHVESDESAIIASHVVEVEIPEPGAVVHGRVVAPDTGGE